MNFKTENVTNVPENNENNVAYNYPIFEFEPSNQILWKLIDRALNMKTAEDISQTPEKKREPKILLRSIGKAEIILYWTWK